MTHISNEDLTSARAGAAAGLMATLVMSVVKLAGQRLGRVGKLPPKKIVQAGFRAVTGHTVPVEAANPVTAVAHLGYGIAVGSAYPLTLGRVNALPSWATGAAFGLLVWALSYEGWVPAAGIMPPARRDRKDRVRTMVLAHVVYGALLGIWSRGARLNRRHAQRSTARF